MGVQLSSRKCYEYEPLTAAGFWVSVVSVVAASYFTAWEEAFRSSKIHRMYLAYTFIRGVSDEIGKGSYAVRRIIFTIQPDNLNDAHLQSLVQRPNRIIYRHDIFDCLGHRAVSKEYESIALAAWVMLGHKERMHQLWGVGNEMFELAVYRVEGEDCVLPDIGMSVFETSPTGGNQGF